ncbi:MAG: rhodanese-like domain-containing protein [Flavobacteriales bacterium]
MNEITIQEFEQLKNSGKEYQLVDVREPFEFDIVNMGGELIPMGSILEQKERIALDKPVIFQCKSGGRSANVTRYFEQMGYTNVYNLKGGILAYIQEVAPHLPTY